MKIVLDTSAIYGDLSLSKTKIRALCEKSKITGNQVYLPEVVIEEAKNKFAEDLTSTKGKINKELSDLLRITGEKLNNPVSDDFISEQITTFNRILERQIENLGIKKIQYPNTTHEQLVKKALKRKKPFAEGGRGYRDALIWENIKSLVQAQQKLTEADVIFITKNHKDFCEKDYSLHQDLIEDLHEYNIPISAIKIKEDIDGFTNEYITPHLKLLNSIKDKLNRGDLEKLGFKAALSNLLVDFLDNRQFDSNEINFPQEFENPSVTEIHEDYRFNIGNVSQLSDEEILISGDVEVTCTFDFFIYKSDYYSMDDRDTPNISDLDWNDHYVAAYEEREIKVAFLLSVDTSLSNIISSELELIE